MHEDEYIRPQHSCWTSTSNPIVVEDDSVRRFSEINTANFWANCRKCWKKVIMHFIYQHERWCIRPHNNAPFSSVVHGYIESHKFDRTPCIQILEQNSCICSLCVYSCSCSPGNLFCNSGKSGIQKWKFE